MSPSKNQDKAAVGVYNIKTQQSVRFPILPRLVAAQTIKVEVSLHSCSES